MDDFTFLLGYFVAGPHGKGDSLAGGILNPFLQTCSQMKYLR